MKRPFDQLCNHCGGVYASQGFHQHQEACDGELDPEHDPELVDPEQMTASLRRELGDGFPDVELPPAEQVGADDESPPDDDESGSDEGSPELDESCPGCDSDDVVPADVALDEYRDQVESPSRSVVRAFQGASRYCNSCQSLSGDRYEQPRALADMFEVA